MKGNTRKYTSLPVKTARLVRVVSLFFILAGNFAGLILYGYHSLQVYKTESKHLMDFCLSLEDRVYIEKIFKETREIYDQLPEEVRADISSEAFINSFRPLVDDDFYAARDILVKARESSGYRNIFLMFQDPERDYLVYVVDGDVDEWAYLPGSWIENADSDIEAISKSSWKIAITHTPDYGWIGSNMKPLYGDDGHMLGYAVVDLDLNEFMHRIFRAVLLQFPIVLITVIFLVRLSAWLLEKHILSHLTALEKAAKDYTQRDNLQINEDTPSVFSPLNIETADELEDLWRSMTIMEKDVKETMIRLRKITAKQERIEADLSAASRIQSSMLPHDFPVRSEFGLSASMNPAKEVGGDFYDFFMIDQSHIALVIADVSGKGMPAALFMVISKTLIKNRALLGGTPSEILYDVNNQLCKDNKGQMFVTVWMALIDIETGKGVAVNAGHEHPVLRRSGGTFELVKYRHSPMVAVMSGLVFEEHEFLLTPGDRLFVYTDGVPEASNEKGDLFGLDRMVESLNKNRNTDIKELLEQIKKDIDSFAGEAEQFDDITMLVFDYKGM